jgi:hypothetical protein
MREAEVIARGQNADRTYRAMNVESQEENKENETGRNARKRKEQWTNE